MASFLSGCAGAPLSALHGANEQARHIATVWYAMAWGSAIIVALVLGLTFMAVRWGKSEDNRKRNRWLLLGGGVVWPVSVIAALLAYTYGAAPPPEEPRYRIEVTGHQWWWEVRYPDAPGGPRQSVNQLHIPAGTPVLIELRAADVIHGFWVPKLGVKMDAIPGRTNRLALTAPEAGVYAGTCAEFCGPGHARMRLQVVAHEEQALTQALSTMDRAAGARHE